MSNRADQANSRETHEEITLHSLPDQLYPYIFTLRAFGELLYAADFSSTKFEPCADLQWGLQNIVEMITEKIETIMNEYHEKERRRVQP